MSNEHITVDIDDALIEAHCQGCDEGLAAPNKGFGRALIASWKTQHQDWLTDGDA